MKKTFLSVIIALCSIGMHAQNPVVDLLMDEIILNGNFSLWEVGITYSYMNADNTFSVNNSKHSSWNAIGLTFTQYVFDTKQTEGYFSCLLDYGWASQNKNSVFNINGAFNIGYNFPLDSMHNAFVTPHVGIGCNGDILYMNDRQSYYYGEAYYQYTGSFPVGVKLKYKHVFADFTYMLRFARSKIRYLDDEQIIYDYLYKSERNIASHIQTFPFVFSIGYRF